MPTVECVFVPHGTLLCTVVHKILLSHSSKDTLPSPMFALSKLLLSIRKLPPSPQPINRLIPRNYFSPYCARAHVESCVQLKVSPLQHSAIVTAL